MVEFMIFYDEIYDLVSRGFAEKKVEKHNHKKKNILKKASVVSPTAATFYF